MDRLLDIKYRLQRESDPNTNTDEKLENGATADWVTHAESDMWWLIGEVEILRKRCAGKHMGGLTGDDMDALRAAIDDPNYVGT